MGPGKPVKSWNYIVAFPMTGKFWKKATRSESSGNLLIQLNA